MFKLWLVKSELIKISKVKSNPDNPRLIKDIKFKKLVNSIKEFPKMLELRPIVVNDDMIVLGGNMRLKACKEAGLKEVYIVKASKLSAREQREFTIKDNVGFGEWDWDMLANEWDNDLLNEWGLDLWVQSTDLNELMESDLDLTEDFDPIGKSKGMQRVVFIFDGQEEAASYLSSQNIKYKKRNMAWQVNMSSKENIN